jgi:hypothetical protein
MTATAAPLPPPRWHRSAFSIGIAVVALVGVPAIWLPFAYDISPASVLFHDEWQLAWPYLLAIPIAVALFRWVASGRLSNAERWYGRLLAVGAWCVTGSFFVEPISHGNWGDLTAFLVPLAMLAGGVALAVWAMRSGRVPDGLDAIVMMEVAYLPNVVLCVLAASSWNERLQLGAYAALLTSVVYVIQILAVLLTRSAPRPV